MKRKQLRRVWILFFIVILLLFSTIASAADEWVVEPYTTKTVNETTRLKKLTIGESADLVAPEGYSLTLTVDGVETGQVLKEWSGKEYKFAPGVYRGDIVLTVAEANNVARAMTGGSMPEGAPQGGMPDGARGEGMPEAAGARGAGLPEGGMPPGSGMPIGTGGTGAVAAAPVTRTGGAYSFRQALYLDENGIDYDKSVLAAVNGEKPSGFTIQNIWINSEGSLYKNPSSPGGTGFTGIYAAGGEYTIKNVDIDFFGDGLNDFIGYGAGIVAGGENTKLVLDNVHIHNHGVVRAGVIVKDGSKVVVKNSDIEIKGGVLPPDDPFGQSGEMRSTLWISGMKGNVRATSVLGENTEATYINTSVSSDGWGVLSTDGTKNVHLNAINCKVSLTGEEGYGNYNDPSAHVAYYGCEFDMATFASAIGSGDVYYGDCTPKVVASLNKKFNLGLTKEEIKSIPVKPTIINSRKYAVMWHRSGNPLTVDGGTIFNTAKTTFIVSGVPAVLTMDGAGGAQINTGNGVIMQVASDDQPAGMMGEGSVAYEEPATAPEPIEGFDNTSADEAATANFSNIDLQGDFYNSVGWGKLTDKLNMVLNLDNVTITGVISASESHHPSPRITKANQREFHAITDTPCPAVNNGVIVNLSNGSNWTVTGTSYLTQLAIDKSSSVSVRRGAEIYMTVNGAKTEIASGKTYTGAIVVSVK